MTSTESPLSYNAMGLNLKDFPLAKTRHSLQSYRGLISLSLVLFSYPMCRTDSKEANHTGSITVPLRRWPAMIPPNFMQFSSTSFGFAMTQMHLFGAGLTRKQNCVMFTERDTNVNKKTGKV